MEFQGKVVIVTGGSKGIGAATVSAFAEQGASVAIVDLDQASGEDISRKLREKGLSVSFIQVDITQEAEVQSMVRRVLDLWGHLDILINMVNIPENIDLRDTFAQQSIQYLKQIERQLA